MYAQHHHHHQQYRIVWFILCNVNGIINTKTIRENCMHEKQKTKNLNLNWRKKTRRVHDDYINIKNDFENVFFGFFKDLCLNSTIP